MINQSKSFWLPWVVAEYMSHLGGEYYYERMKKIDHDQERRSLEGIICPPNTTWNLEQLTCEDDICQQHNMVSKVTFSPDRVDLLGNSSRSVTDPSRVYLFNGEDDNVSALVFSHPSWIVLMDGNNSSSTNNDSWSNDSIISEGSTLLLGPGDNVSLDVVAVISDFDMGSTVYGEIDFMFSLDVNHGRRPEDASDYCAASSFGLDVTVFVNPTVTMHYLGSIVYAGYTFMGIAIAFTLVCGVWVHCHRTARVVVSMQPPFLYAICVGIIIFLLGIIPSSVDDQHFSQRSCDIACMAIQWTYGMGWTILHSSLFSKLWRINKLFHNRQFRRTMVLATDVIAPFAVLFGINVIILTVWTIYQPNYWIRRPMHDVWKWDTVGYCEYGGTAGIILNAATSIVNFIALLLAGYQAYRARTICSEFSESKTLGWGLLSLVQLTVMAQPLFYLIQAQNVAARYWVEVVYILGYCVSVLVAIFIPMMSKFRDMKKKKKQQQQRTSQEDCVGPPGGRHVKVTGLAPADADATTTDPRHGIYISQEENRVDRTNAATYLVDMKPVVNDGVEEQVHEVEKLQGKIELLEQRNRELQAFNEELGHLIRGRSVERQDDWVEEVVGMMDDHSQNSSCQKNVKSNVPSPDICSIP